MPTLIKRPQAPPSTLSRHVQRRERLAVNVVDLTRVEEPVRSLLVSDHLDFAGGAIRTDPDRIDEAAVAFSCDLLTAACICDTLREHNKRSGEYPTRVYLRRGTAWTKLSGQVTLTRVVGDRVELDYELFPPEVHAGDLVVPTAEAVIL